MVQRLAALIESAGRGEPTTAATVRGRQFEQSQPSLQLAQARERHFAIAANFDKTSVTARSDFIRAALLTTRILALQL